jgi:hypothetical protein
MDKTIHPLIDTWSVERPFAYFAFVVLGSLAVRFVSAVLKSLESSAGSGGFHGEFKKCFRGFGSKEQKHDDHWHPFILGLFELSAYPVLMVTENWTFIGAWLAFKTLAQWKRWEEKRTAFNRFLIGNLLVLFLSMLWLTQFVALTKKGTDDGPTRTVQRTGASRSAHETNQTPSAAGFRR